MQFPRIGSFSGSDFDFPLPDSPTRAQNRRTSNLHRIRRNPGSNSDLTKLAELRRDQEHVKRLPHRLKQHVEYCVTELDNLLDNKAIASSHLNEMVSQCDIVKQRLNLKRRSSPHEATETFIQIILERCFSNTETTSIAESLQHLYEKLLSPSSLLTHILSSAESPPEFVFRAVNSIPSLSSDVKRDILRHLSVVKILTNDSNKPADELGTPLPNAPLFPRVDTGEVKKRCEWINYGSDSDDDE